MTGPALPPEAALAWLGSLSIDLEATAVVDLDSAGEGRAAARDAALGAAGAGQAAACDAALGAASVGDPAARGAVLAGDPALGRRAAQALAAAPGATEVDHGDLLAVRSGRHAVAASVGRHALRRLARADLAAAAAALGDT